MKRRTRPAVLRTAPCHWGKMFLKEAKIVLKEEEETTARFQAMGGLSRPRGCSESPCGAGAVPTGGPQTSQTIQIPYTSKNNQTTQTTETM